MRRLLVAALIASTLVISAPGVLAADYKIMIATWRGCEEACTGFQDYLTEAGHDVEFLIRDAARDPAKLPDFIGEARAEQVDLILTWGTSVSQGIAGTLDQFDDNAIPHEIPRVFTVVADPVGAQIVESLEATGRANVAGTFNRVPERVNIETIRTYYPAFTHLGLLFNRNERNSVLKEAEIAALSKDMGFDYTSVELPLYADGKPRSGDIAPGMAQLKAAGVEFVYLGSSSFLDVNRDIYTKAALDSGLPVLSPYERLVRDSHALLSIAARHYDTGRLAGRLAEKILVEGALPGDLPVARMTEFAFVINMEVARELKLFPPLDLLQVAETVK